jgi:cytochrome c-type biogenesis protein CcmF
MQRIDGIQSASIFTKLTKLTPSHWGMVLGHVGFAVTLIGITLVSNFEQEKDLRMSPNDQISLGGYEFTLVGIETLEGPNYGGHVGLVDVHDNGDFVTQLRAEKRFYPVQRSSMTEAGIDSGLTRDLFVALGEQLNSGAWAIRIYVKPFVNWIWAGALFMALGGIFSISDKRYRMAKVAKMKSRVSRSSTEVNG